MRGLPDFGAPLGASGFAGFDEPGAAVALPDRLSLATDPDGTPRLLLERFRSVDPNRSEQSYGLLSAWFTLGWPDLVDDQPATTRAIPDSGELRLHLDQADGQPTLVGEPMPWDGSLAASWGARVSPDTITWMIAALRMRLLPLQVQATLWCRGVAPRLPLRVRLDGDALATLVPGEARDAATALIAELTTPTGVVTVLGGQAPPERVAQAIIDRLDANVARPAGIVEWDLAQPVVTHRRVELTRELRDHLTGPLDEARLIPAGATVPALDLGWKSLDVISNLPALRSGVIASGVNLVSPPRPPARHQAAMAGCEFTEGQSRQRVTLRLAPGEDLEYVSEPWLIVDGEAGAREVKGVQRTHTSARLIVSPADLGVPLAHVSADPALLDIATVEVSLQRGAWTGAPVTLDLAHPEAVLVVEDDGAPEPEPRLHLRVLAVAGDGVITLPDRSAGHVCLSLAAVPGWGQHAVACHNPGAGTAAIELADEAGAASTVIAVRPGETRTWRYFTTDPFRPGYRWRHRPAGEPGAWHRPSRDLFDLTIGDPT